jgi:hypothetical protein
LNLLLNAHPDAIGLCELHTIRRHLSLPDDDPRHPLQHPFWQAVAKCWENKILRPFHEIDIATPTRRQRRLWDADQRRAYVNHNRALFECVASTSGASVIIDSSHNRWRLLELDKACGMNLKVIHIVRDGRALVNSYSRKYKSLRVGFRRWFVPAVMGLVLRPQVRAPWMTVRYEDLATNPKECLEGICAFVGLQYEPGMLRYWEHDDVSIGGNRMIKRKSPVRLDERWRRELSFTGKAVFAVLGSWLNCLSGYPHLRSRRHRHAVAGTTRVGSTERP